VRRALLVAALIGFPSAAMAQVKAKPAAKSAVRSAPPSATGAADGGSKGAGGLVLLEFP